MSQFYLPGPWLNLPVLAPDTLRHHLRVRRIDSNEFIRVFDGEGRIAKAQISPESTDKLLRLDLKEIHEDLSTEPRYKIVLAQGIAGGDKMDWLIEKSVELGVSEIIPLQADRSVVRLDEKRAVKRLAHWQALVIAASEQSGRTVIPKILPVQSTTSWLKSQSTKEFATDELKILLSPRGEIGFVSILKRAPGQDLVIMIGPEGGFCDEEENLALKSGFVPALLGKRILRTETAGIVMMSAVHTVWGGF